MRFSIPRLLALAISVALTSPATLAKGKPDKEIHHGNGKGLPPGLQKKVNRGKPLPPGWQKKVVAGEVMSREVYEHAIPLSYKESVRYGARHGELVVRVENKLVRLIGATLAILEVLEE